MKTLVICLLFCLSGMKSYSGNVNIFPQSTPEIVLGDILIIYSKSPSQRIEYLKSKGYVVDNLSDRTFTSMTRKGVNITFFRATKVKNPVPLNLSTPLLDCSLIMGELVQSGYKLYYTSGEHTGIAVNLYRKGSTFVKIASYLLKGRTVYDIVFSSKPFEEFNISSN